MTRCWRPMRPTRMRGEKGVPHLDPEDPPRRRANKIPGHGTWDNDRPPVCGVVGREGGQIRLSVHRPAVRRRDAGHGRAAPRVGLMVEVNTDEWCGYNGLPAMGRSRTTVCHAAGEWARDDDGDGIREVHVNTLGGVCGRACGTLLRPLPGSEQGIPVSVCGDVLSRGYNVKRVIRGVRVRTCWVCASATICPT